MKKLIATSLCLGLLGTAAFAQGYVAGGNAPATDIYTVSNGVNTATGGSASATYDYEVLTAPSTLQATGLLTGYGPTGGSLAALLASPWSDTAVSFNNSALNGRASCPQSPANNWPVGADQDYIVVGWSANLGNWAAVSADLASAVLGSNSTGGLQWTFNGSVNGYLGATVVGDIPSGPTGAGAALFGAQTTGNSPVNTTTALYAVVSIPEPTTFALAGLGAASLLIFRRRK